MLQIVYDIYTVPLSPARGEEEEIKGGWGVITNEKKEGGGVEE